MNTLQGLGRYTALILLSTCLPVNVLAGNIISSSGFTNCLNNATITVNNANVEFDRTTLNVTFDVSGTSSKVQEVTASLIVTAYGQQVYQKSFDPCDHATYVEQLCPVPAGTFSAQGSQLIPASYASQIPSIAFTIPDLDGQATLKLTSKAGGQDLACIESGVTNGQTLDVSVVSYASFGIVGAALILTGVSAFGTAGTVGAHGASPSFGTVLGWFQSMAMNGMLSVNYPPIYRSFTKNFGFSGGLIPWAAMQTSIDNFRKMTGGNLTTDNYLYLQNATLVHTDGSSNTTALKKRFAEVLSASMLDPRDITTAVNGSQSGGAANKATQLVHGIQGYVEELSIPQANTFMTVLLIFAIVLGAITVGILLFKVILETWALFASFPKRLTSFRKRYWRVLANTVVNLILLLYGVWTLYCVFQFTNGDSWAAKLLAALTLGIFTAVLAFFTIRIWLIARKYKKAEGDAAALFENKETWIKYSLFYDSYKHGYWWMFMPAIIYMFAKGCVIAAADGHGLTQTVGQLIVESIMLALLLFTRPHATKGGNWINIIIQVVRALSVLCILVFVEQLGIAQSTKTITGVVLIAVQSGLTAVLAILIAVNAIITCCKENPHRKRRKEAEKLAREFDNLTPLDARNSLLINPPDDAKGYPMGPYRGRSAYEPILISSHERFGSGDSTDRLVPSSASLAPSYSRSPSQDTRSFRGYAPSIGGKQPTIPDMGIHTGVTGREIV